MLYITPAELVNAATGIDWLSLPVAAASSAQRLQEQTNIIRRASAWVDAYCQQQLDARIIVSPPRAIGGDRVGWRDSGFYALLDGFPLVSVSLVEWSVDGVTFNTIAPPYTVLLTGQQSVTILPGGTIQLTGSGYGWGPGWLRITYVAGFANALLTSNASASAVTLAVDERAGFTPGQKVTIYDVVTGTTIQEDVTVSSSYVAATGPGNLTVSACVYAHLAGTRVSAIPDDIRQATILASTAYARTRGRTSISVNQAGGGRTTRTASLEGDEFARARILLGSFKVWQ